MVPQSTEEPADHDIAPPFTLFTGPGGDGTWVTGCQTHRLKGFKAHEDMSPCPKSTHRTVRTTPWPEGRALFLHDEGSWQSTFSWEPRPYT